MNLNKNHLPVLSFTASPITHLGTPFSFVFSFLPDIAASYQSSV